MLAELELYYRNNYTRCRLDDSFIADSTHLSAVAHFLSMTLLPFYTFGGYCILVKTPVSMRQVKWPLFTVYFWSTFNDFLTTSLVTPYFYFPSLSGFCLGILGRVGPTSFLVYLAAVCIWAMIFSISALFENRFNSIPGNDWKIRRRSRRILYHASRTVVCLLYPIPMLVFSPDQERAKLETLKILPCPSPDFFTAPVFTMQTDGVLIHASTYFTIFLASFEAAQTVFFGTYCLYFLCFSPTRFVSVRTRRLQAYYFVSIVIQIGVSASSVILPFAFFVTSVITGYHNQTITNLCVLFFAIHGFLSTVVVVLVHAPYRNFVRSCILKATYVKERHSAKLRSTTQANLF